jgi:hypothetical protein
MNGDKMFEIEKLESARPKSCQELLKEYQKRAELEGFPQAEFLNFRIKEDVKRITVPFEKELAVELTVYNPSKPIEVGANHRLLPVRVEPKQAEFSQVIFFEENGPVWEPVLDLLHFDLQDPFYIENIDGEHIFGGVKAYPDSKDPAVLCYKTVFWRFKNNLSELIGKDGNAIEPFAVGPERMKDIRLVQIAPKRIGVFSRPQGGVAGRGKIAYTEIDSLDKLKPETISNSEIIEGFFQENEWGGVNDLHFLENGLVGAVGHIAEEINGKKNYYGMSFIFNPDTRSFSNLKIIATAFDCPPVQVKKPDLGSILYPGGLKTEEGETFLYAGVGDTKAVRLKIKNPFVL